MFPGEPQSSRDQRRPVDDCRPERGGMAQNGRTRGGTFQSEMNRCRESQRWTTACSGMPERDGKDQGKGRIAPSKRARAVRSPVLTSHKWRELLSSGRLVCRCHDVFLWCYVCFVLLRFRLYAFVQAAALRSIVLRYAGAPIATRVCVCVCFFEVSLFPSLFCTISVFSLNGEYVVRSFLPNGVFLPCGHGLDFSHKLM